MGGVEIVVEEIGAPAGAARGVQVRTGDGAHEWFGFTVNSAQNRPFLPVLCVEPANSRVLRMGTYR